MQKLLMSAVLILPALPNGTGEEAKAPRERESLRVQAGKELRAYPVRDLIRKLSRVDAHQLGSAMIDEGGWEPFPLFREDVRPLSMDDLIELVRGSYEATLEREGLQLFEGGSRLMAVEEKDCLDKIDSWLAQIRKSAMPRIQYEYVLFEAGRGNPLPATKLTAADAKSLVERLARGDGGRILYRGNAEGRPGDALELGEIQKSKFVGDHNIEVAQKAMIGDPITMDLELGHGVELRGYLSPDGRSIGIFGMWTDREVVDGFELEDSTAFNLNMLEKARVQSLQRVFSLRSNGADAFLLAPGGMARPELRVLLICHAELTPPQASSNLVLVPTALLTSKELRDSIENPKRHDGIGPLIALGKPDLSPDLLLSSLNSLVAGVDESRCDALANHWILLGGKPDFVSRGRDLIRFLGKDATRSFVVELVREAVPTDQDDWKQARRLGQPLRVYCMGGRFGYVMDAREETYVADYNVEIAQEAEGADPVVEVLKDGLYGLVAVEVQGKGAIVNFSLRDSSMIDMRRVSSPTKKVGSVELPVMRRVRVEQNVVMKIGETRSLGELAQRRIDGRLHRTRLSARLIEPQ